MPLAAEPIDVLAAALDAWHGSDAFNLAVHGVVQRTGYAREDVERQLLHVIERCRPEAMRACRAAEVPDHADRTRPSSTLVLASAGVPGLVIEAIAAALTVGARALVRPSRDEIVLDHLLAAATTAGIPLDAHVQLVGLGENGIPWELCDSAIVYGTDETIALVHANLPEAAGARVAGYGSRQGIAIIDESVGGIPGWARALADDILTFRQRGCMSPSWLYVLADEDETAEQLVETIGRELALARTLHVDPAVDDAVAQRRSSDADVLGAIAEGFAPDPSVLYAGDARITVVHVRDESELRMQLYALGSLLQTAVIASSERWAELSELAASSGCSRIVEPGRAHLPESTWPQDGIGRVAPLLQ